MAKKKKSAKKSKRVPAKKTGKQSKRNHSLNGMGAVNSHIKQARVALETALSKKMLDQYKATNKRDKAKIGKDITTLKARLNKLS